MRIDDVIGDARTVGIGGHIRSDGDLYRPPVWECSLLSAQEVSKDLVWMVLSEEIPEEYRLIKDT